MPSLAAELLDQDLKVRQWDSLAVFGELAGHHWSLYCPFFFAGFRSPILFNSQYGGIPSRQVHALLGDRHRVGLVEAVVLLFLINVRIRFSFLFLHLILVLPLFHKFLELLHAQPLESILASFHMDLFHQAKAFKHIDDIIEPPDLGLAYLFVSVGEDDVGGLIEGEDISVGEEEPEELARERLQRFLFSNFFFSFKE